MKRSLLLLSLFAVGCSSTPPTVTAPSAPAAAVAAITMPGATADWDRTQLGRALITVPMPTVGTFFIFRVTAAGQVDYRTPATRCRGDVAAWLQGAA